MAKLTSSLGNGVGGFRKYHVPAVLADPIFADRYVIVRTLCQMDYLPQRKPDTYSEAHSRLLAEYAKRIDEQWKNKPMANFTNNGGFCWTCDAARSTRIDDRGQEVCEECFRRSLRWRMMSDAEKDAELNKIIGPTDASLNVAKHRCNG